MVVCSPSLEAFPRVFRESLLSEISVLRGRSDAAEQAIGFTVRTRGEVERIGARVPATTQGEGPQPVDHDRLAFAVPEGAEELPVGVERMDFPIAEVADENVAAEPAKRKGCPHEAPWRVQRAARREAPQQMAVGVENVDKAIARARHVVMLELILQRVGDEEITVDVLDTEGREPIRNVRV